MPKQISHLLLSLLILLSVHSFGQTATVYFYRLKSGYLPNTTCRVTLNDTLDFTFFNGSYREVKTKADVINIKTSLNNTGIQSIKLQKGQTYYVEVVVKNITTVNLAEQPEHIGKPAIERLIADEKAEGVNTSSLKTIKVNAIENLPQPEEGKAKVYIYRPFNVGGLNINAQVVAGDSMFVMRARTSHTHTTTASELTLYTANEQTSYSNSNLKLKLEKGKVYYVAVLFTGGAILLTETKEDYAKREMKLK